MKELYTKNYKIFLNKFKEDANKWKDMCVQRLEDFTFQISILPKIIYVCNTVHTKISAACLTKMETPS